MFGTGTVEGCPFGNCLLMSDVAIRGGMDPFVCCIMAWKIAGSGNKDNILLIGVHFLHF